MKKLKAVEHKLNTVDISKVPMKIAGADRVKCNDGKYIDIDTGHYVYSIKLSRCNTYVKMLHWVKHLSGKTWMTTDMISRFIELAATDEQMKAIWAPAV